MIDSVIAPMGRLAFPRTYFSSYSKKKRVIPTPNGSSRSGFFVNTTLSRY